MCIFLSGSTQSPSSEQQQKRKKMTVDDVFNNDDEEVAQAKKRKLVPLDYTEEEKAAVPPSAAHLTALATAATTSAEEKRKSIKNLIERIPTAKDDLFAFSLDWSMVDSVCVASLVFLCFCRRLATGGIWFCGCLCVVWPSVCD